MQSSRYMSKKDNIRFAFNQDDGSKDYDKIREDFEKHLDFNREIIERLQIECLKDKEMNKLKDNDSVDSDDCIENATVFEFMNYEQRRRHTIQLWNKAFYKAKGAAVVVRFTSDVQNKIMNLGRTNNI